jgi:Double-GTPase 2
MTETAIVGCDQEGCPILAEGRCLENFPDAEGCPHVQRGEAPLGAGHGDALEQSAQTIEETPGATDPPETGARVELGGDESLTTNDADALAAKHGARVVLVAGEFYSGKTTLIAELYGQFLSGPFCGWCFAGSDVLYALDRRYHGARASSGLEYPDTPRTEEEEMRLLDLRARRDERLLSLMFSDIRGEFFDNVTQGAPVADQLPLASRSDIALVLVDGAKIGDKFRRAEAISRARQLIGGLTEAGGLPREVPFGIALSKADAADHDGKAWFQSQVGELQAFAESRIKGPIALFTLAARPPSSTVSSEGLDDVFQWLADEHKVVEHVPAKTTGFSRSFWRDQYHG